MDTAAHNDLRLALQGLSDRINAALDSDDTTLDQMSEVVAYIKSNKSLIDAITTSKVSVTDIVNDLVTNAADKPLSSAQGVVLKVLIDALRNDKLDAAELTNAINTALAQAKASGEFDGADGITPHIGANGNWYLGDTDTGKPSRGETGAPGPAGADGKDGVTPNIQIGTVETLPSGSPATASITGTAENPLLNLGIPKGADGSGDGASDWELIAEITSDGAGTNSGLFAPISFNSYKELHLEATSIADSSITFRLMLSKTTNWYDGQAIIYGAATNAVAYMAHFWIIDGCIKVISGRNSGYSDAQNDGTCKFVNSPRNAYLASDYAYIRFDANNSVVPEGATLKIWGVK